MTYALVEFIKEKCPGVVQLRRIAHKQLHAYVLEIRIMN